MRDPSNDAGTIQILLDRLNNAAPAATLELKAGVDRGQRLDDHDMQFLTSVLEDSSARRTLRPEYPRVSEPLVARLTGLYGDITRKALENEQNS